MRLTITVAIAVAMFGGATAPSGPGRITGVVVNAEQVSIASARVNLVGATGASSEVVTTADGKFALERVPAGAQSILVRAIGHAPRTMLVSVPEDGIADVRVILERVVSLPAVVTRDSIAQARVADFLHEKRSAGYRGFFIQPARLEGYDQMQTACQLISNLPLRTDACRPPSRVPPRCDGFMLNGRATWMPLTDVDPADILAVSIPAPPRYHRPSKICNVAVWTRCPEGTVPSCRELWPTATPKTPEESAVGPLIER